MADDIPFKIVKGDALRVGDLIMVFGGGRPFGVVRAIVKRSDYYYIYARYTDTPQTAVDYYRTASDVPFEDNYHETTSIYHEQYLLLMRDVPLKEGDPLQSVLTPPSSDASGKVPTRRMILSTPPQAEKQ